MLKRPVILCASLLFAAALVLGIARLFALRLDQGDIYPAYSTLRTDPLGASVFYESLARVPDVTSRRYLEKRFKIDDGKGRTLFVLGAEPYSLGLMSRSEFDVLQRFVFGGGRIVLGYVPEVAETYSSRRARLDETNHPSGKRLPDHPSASPAGPTNSASDTNYFAHFSVTNAGAAGEGTNSAGVTNEIEPADEELKMELRRYVRLGEEWGFDIGYHNLNRNGDDQFDFPRAKLVESNTALPPVLVVHTALCFTNLAGSWEAVYQRSKGMPVVVERKLGAGSVVLVADSYPFSNEALFRERSPALLAWLLGGGREAIFDEAHLGVVEEPGVATLMRRYRLYGLAFSLIIVGALFIWKNSSSLVPALQEGENETGAVIAGRDSSAGLVNLLRRGIPPAELINVCFAEWKKSGARLAAVSPGQRREVEQIIGQQAALEPRRRQPVENYRAIAEVLKRRK